MEFAIAGNALGLNITVFDDSYEYPQVASSTANPNFDEIVKLAREGQHIPIDLFDPSKIVAEKFKGLSERVSISGGTLYFDHEPVHNSLAEHVVRFLKDGVDDWEPLVRFFEKIQQNPNNHSRDQLYDWLGRYDFTIDDDGDIVAYKGVYKDPEGQLFSINHGTAIVNGEKISGAIPNEIDSVVEMPRTQVHHNPANGCSTGLHAGTYEYASSFAEGALLQVTINPRDVVSVPTDCAWQKVRCCRYRVIDVIDHKISAPVHNSWDNRNQDWDDDDLDWGDGDGEDWDEDGIDDAEVTGQDPYDNDVNTHVASPDPKPWTYAAPYDPATGLAENKTSDTSSESKEELKTDDSFSGTRWDSWN